MAVIGVFLSPIIDLGLLVIIGIAFTILALIILILEIMMLIGLNNAKNASPHPNLVKAYYFLLTNILIGVVGIFNRDPLFEFVLDVASTIVVFFAYKSLAEYVEIYRKEAPPSPEFHSIAEGIKMYTISVSLTLGMQVVSFFLSFMYSSGLTIAMVIISFIIVIYSFIASFKIANGIMAVFGQSITPGSPSPSQSMYGNTAPQSTSHIPDNSSMYRIPNSDPATTIQPTTAGEKYCSQCGAILDPVAKFCGVCGYTITQ